MNCHKRRPINHSAILDFYITHLLIRKLTEVKPPKEVQMSMVVARAHVTFRGPVYNIN